MVDGLSITAGEQPYHRTAATVIAARRNALKLKGVVQRLPVRSVLRHRKTVARSNRVDSQMHRIITDTHFCYILILLILPGLRKQPNYTAGHQNQPEEFLS